MQVAVAAATINTIEDLVRVLDENPEWLEALRARLLTRELLEMPQKLAAFAEATERQFEAGASIDRRFEAIDRQFETIDRRFEASDRRFAQLLSDIAPIKAAHARNAAVREADLIAEDSGLSFVRVLSDAQVAELARSSLAAGETCYLAAEISFTVNGRDTDRAIRNAGLLTQFTGQPASAVVAGLRHDRRIKKHLEAGEVSWYRLDPHTLEVE